ncbi:tripartite tricarboxylate transporter substrate binding protein [Roseomonas sp. NAR14]|uniref:Tripartite tricarboxylate transporter substrate binding protein n=1 Tax=Roseomonas acroporae TaxID=2937791 RepID=A0A9X1YB43_9PROT|nr:tripartite tricarboxylate transporter substrate binding protein [Roseomonas acroporae]MCK8787179.1 tripartite tricarboxylate transporter substrate binding protein [Roseomonas acroporae]
MKRGRNAMRRLVAMRRATTRLAAMLLTAGLAGGALLAAPPAAAQPAAPAASAASWPDRTIRMIVPFAAGGTADIVARLTASCLTPVLGQTVIVDNRGGAGGTIGTEAAARAAPDGYTVALHTVSSAVLNSFLYRHLPYDARRDFAAVSQVAMAPNVLAVRADLPARNLREFIALLRARPGHYSYGSSGAGTILHLSAALLVRMAGVEATHVPYRGEGPALNDLVAGQIDFMVNVVPALLPYIREGRLRALGVTTATRSAALPDVPTIAEAGLPGYETYIWHGLFVPAATPRAIVERLSEATARAVQEPGCRQRFTDLGVDPVGSRADAFTDFWDEQLRAWGPVVRNSGATLD